MKFSLQFNFLFACGLLLAGCTSYKVADDAPVEQVPSVGLVVQEAESTDEPVSETNDVPELLKLTIIRIEPDETAPELLLYMQGKMVAVIGNMSYATLELPAGQHVLEFDWEDTSIQFHEEVVMDPDWHEERYMSVVHHYDVPEITRKDGNVGYTLEETLAIFELPAKYAKGVIKNLDPEMSYVFEPEE